jgi:predicted AlkP superfamily pyrophosphatase or phosphodiesterase
MKTRSPFKNACGRLAGAVLCLLLFLNPVFAGLPEQKAKDPAVKLIVLITVDQLRGDLLERYDPVFTGGFRRLLDRGLRYTRATVDHAPTNSYPGHVTIATGANPARHGIVDNSWAERVGDKLMMTGGAVDPTEKIVGFPKMQGVSPGKLLVTGLADWVLAQDEKASVVCISSNEYGSLLHSGKARAETFWFSPEAGQYVTSTYYRKDYPDWVTRFNREAMPRFIGQKNWKLTVPKKFRQLALPDATPYEFDNIHNTFPHIFEKETPKEESGDPQALADWFYFSPFTDEAALALTHEAIRNLKLGQRNSTDYLSLTLGSTDSIGHRFGPLSLEQMDNLMRLDRGLGNLFEFLDRQVGADRYIVAVTGDHGASDIPEHGKSGRRVTENDMDELLGEVGEYVSKTAGEPEKMRAGITGIAEKFEFVGDAFTRDELESKENKDALLGFYRNSFYPGRTPIYPIVSRKYPALASFGIRIRLAENAVPYFAPSNHGTPHFYDRHVTLVFMGKDIRSGIDGGSARTVDIAPTLAKRGKIKVPVETDGRVLLLSGEKASEK